MGGFSVEGDSSDEEFELLPSKTHHCARCVERLLVGNPADCTPGPGAACVQCGLAHAPCE